MPGVGFIDIHKNDKVTSEIKLSLLPLQNSYSNNVPNKLHLQSLIF